VLTSARRPIVPRSPRLPLRSTTILAAEHHVRELIAMIRQPVRVNPRGIALARLLLANGTGPLFNPRRSADLAPALHAAATSLRISSVDNTDDAVQVRPGSRPHHAPR
jgi:hypothetical protein